MARISNFRTRLGIVIFSVGLLPLALSLLFYLLIQYNSLYKDSRQTQNLKARYVASEIMAYMSAAEHELKGLNRRQTFPTLSSSRRQELLSEIVFGQTIFHAITFFDAQGLSPETTSRQSIQSAQHRHDMVRKVLERGEPITGVQYSAIHFDQETAEPLISIIVPLTLPQTGKRGGFLVADLMLRPVWNLIARTDVDKNESIYVTDNQNLVIAHKDPSVVLRKSYFFYSPENAIQQGLVFPAAVVAVEPLMLGPYGYQVVVERERLAVLAPLKRMFWVVLLVLLIALPFLAMVMVELRRYILLPVQGVTKAAQRIQEGDYSSRVSYKELDEIGQMANAFNSMSARLVEATSTLDDEQKLRASLIDSMPDLITIKDLDLKLVDCNQAYVNRVGLPKRELVGTDLTGIFDKETEELHSTYEQRVLSNNELARFEIRVEWPNGDIQYLDSIKIPMKSSSGEVIGLISISRDMSAHKEVLNSLRQSEREFRLAIEKMPLPIVLTKANGDIEHFNPKFQESFGWTLHEVKTAQDWWEMAYPDVDYRKRVMDSWAAAISKATLNNEEIAVQQWRLTCKNGATREVEFRMVPLTEERHLIVMNDITERMHAEGELKKHRDHLEELVAQRTIEVQDKASQLEEALVCERKYSSLQKKFVALVSHEFRTPLTIIDGAAQRLIRRNDKVNPDELVTRANKIRAAVTRMISLIDTTLYASRLDAGKIEIEAVPIDIGELLQEICERHAEIAPGHHFNLMLDDLPREMRADHKLLDQVFTNLLSNAVKYAPQAPQIEVKGWQEDNCAVITVTDYGIGIPHDELPYMFGRFFRASTAEGFKGSGLGLNVCKEFVELHGGTIDVASVEGEGTTFTVRIPIACEEHTFHGVGI